MSQISGQRHHPEQAFKLCFGVLQLAKKHGNSKLEEVAAICLQYDIITYNKLEYLFKIDLKNIEDRPEKQIKINHQNLRGAYYYQ